MLCHTQSPCHITWRGDFFCRQLVGCILGIRGVQPCGLPVASAILMGQKYGSFGSKPWHLWVATLRVMGAKCGCGNYWFGWIYIIYVGDINILCKTCRVKYVAW